MVWTERSTRHGPLVGEKESTDNDVNYKECVRNSPGEMTMSIVIQRFAGIEQVYVETYCCRYQIWSPH